MMDEEIRQALREVREMKQMCGNINMKLTNIVTQRGQDWKKKLEAEYQRGLEDGKAVSDKGCKGCKYEGRELNKLPCMVCSNSRKNCWTAKQTDDEIKVGDEVKTIYNDILGTVTNVNGFEVCVLWHDGSVGMWHVNELIKTDRHFDIASILEAMKK